MNLDVYALFIEAQNIYFIIETMKNKQMYYSKWHTIKNIWPMPSRIIKCNYEK